MITAIPPVFFQNNISIKAHFLLYREEPTIADSATAGCSLIESQWEQFRVMT